MPELTDAQKRLIELDAKKPEIKKYYEDLDAALAEVAAESGVDGYFKRLTASSSSCKRPNGAT